jgi:mono/diheme cytochrome c family protein
MIAACIWFQETIRRLIMGKGIKRIGMAVMAAVLLALALVFVASTIRLNRDYENVDVAVDAIPIPGSEAAISRGEHIATTRYCGHCHGDNLAGGYLLDESVLAVIPAPNLTAGVGGVGAANDDQDWIRAIRHGVGRDRRGLIGMPSRVWHMMSDEDLGVLIAYLKTLPPVDNDLPERSIGPLFRLMLALGQAPPSEASLIDHDASRVPAPQPGVTSEYGQYLAQGCAACHGDNMAGGTIRTLDGELVTALNLTRGGELAGWTEADFITAMRTGITPAGRELSAEMPWPYLGQMTDDELKAIWLYLQSLPAHEQGLERTDL